MKSYFIFLTRNKLYTAIQVFGLSVALGLVILLASYARTEFMVGKTQPLSESLYVMGSSQMMAMTVGTGPEICPKIPQIKGYTRAGKRYLWDVKVGENGFSTNAMSIDTTFFQYFDYELRGCDRKKVLESPTDILISEEFCQRAFGDENPIGKSITLLGQEEPLTIVGVVEDFDVEDIFEPVEILFSMRVEEQSRAWLDNFGSIVTFVTLNEGASVEDTKKAVVDKYVELWERFYQREADPDKRLSGVSLTPLSEIYFADISSTSGFRHGNEELIWILVAVALVLLVSAVFNYVNLTTALIGKRAKEIATRRLLGDTVAQVVGRNLLESFVFTAGCFLLGCMVAVIAKPWFEELLGAKISIFSDLLSIGTAVALLLAVSFVAGVIPAIVVSRFKPIDVVKGAFRFQSKMILSRVFIVIQNIISTFLIAVGIVMVAQMHHLATLPMGYRTEGLLQVTTYTYSTHIDQLRPIYNRLLEMPEVKRIGWSNNMPWYCQINGIQEKGEGGEQISSWTYYSSMDMTCMDMLGIEIVEQYCEPENGMHWVTEDARDRYNISANNPNVGGQIEGTACYPVCGVVKNYRSLDPLRGNAMPDGHSIIHIKVNPSRAMEMMVELTEVGLQDVEATKQKMQEVCRTVTKETVGIEKDFPIQTVDEILTEPMEQMQSLLMMVLCFMFISVLISALGLLAMSISYTEQQSKNIALRKVMGATVANASWHLARLFLLLSFIASLLALPLAIKVTEYYLEDYSNRIDFPWWAIVLAVILTLALSLASIAWQTLKVARRNPIESIRRE